MSLFQTILGALGLRRSTQEPVSHGASALGRGRMRVARAVKGAWNVPNAPGLYRILRKGYHLYTGISCDLDRRRREHERSRNLTARDTFCFAVAKPGTRYDDLRAAEKAHIAKWHPARNISAGGNGRGPSRFEK
jgi:hypothetical protein